MLNMIIDDSDQKLIILLTRERTIQQLLSTQFSHLSEAN